MVTTVYIVRHCEAEGNLLGEFQGSIDCDITEKGKLQLIKLHERLKDVRFDAVYSSPLKRALKTARAGAGENADITVMDGLREINGGDFEGRKWSELPSLFPEEFYLWKNDFGNFKAPGGESVDEVYNRMVKSFTEIIAMNKGKTIGIFSHGCSIRTLLTYIKGLPSDRVSETDWSDNTAISCVEISENGKMTLLYENDSRHIENDEKTAACKRHWG